VSGIPLLVEGRAVRALVVGGGAVAARKAAALADAGAAVRVVALAAGAPMRALAQAGRVALVERAYVPGDVGDAHLVVVATSDRAVNAAASEEARASCRLVNVADAPDEGSFATMATHRSGPLVVAVSAGGVPGAAARVRDALAERFDDRYAPALTSLAALRRRMLERGDGAGWRLAARALLASDFCDSVERGLLAERMAPWR
jgi:siroheme synthase-like protein